MLATVNLSTMLLSTNSNGDRLGGLAEYRCLCWWTQQWVLGASPHKCPMKIGFILGAPTKEEEPRAPVWAPEEEDRAALCNFIQGSIDMFVFVKEFFFKYLQLQSMTQLTWKMYSLFLKGVQTSLMQYCGAYMLGVIKIIILQMLYANANIVDNCILPYVKYIL